ncbi:MAG: beta-galactosidase [bacterium]|nr:beta-galactosidase [bacterium]
MGKKKNKLSPKGIEVKNGIFYRDGKPFVLLSADYPYYRDGCHMWEKKLRILKEMGVSVITFYVPWRHHSPTPGEFHFNGETVPNSDMARFLEIIKKLDLYCIVKPGPFIHAETDYGGLPDYVEPVAESGIEPIRNALGEPTVWHKALPAPLDEKFHEHVQKWFEAVDQNVLKDRQYPEGPIVGVQILNEGIYTFCLPDITGYDYSRSGASAFSAFLKNKYHTVREYNARNLIKIQSFDEVLPPTEFQKGEIKSFRKNLDWAEFSGVFYREVLLRYKSYLSSLKVPIVVNWNPFRLTEADTYFSRSNLYVFGDIASWGFTNWTKYPYDDEDAYCIYQAVAGKHQGICLEENWGFSRIYHKMFEKSTPSFYQSMLYFAFGAKGMNYYTGAGTELWDINIDSFHEKPYPAAPPITHDCIKTDKFYLARMINLFFGSFGKNAVESEVEKDIYWGCYMPYCWAASWKVDDTAWKKSGIKERPVCIEEGLMSFMKKAARYGFKTGVKYLDYESDAEIAGAKTIILKLSDWMCEKVQVKLLKYMKNGGKLIIFGTIPYLDEDFKTSNVLLKSLFPQKNAEVCSIEKNIGKGKIHFIAGDLLSDDKKLAGILGQRKRQYNSYDVAVSSGKDEKIIYAISKDSGTSEYRIPTGKKELYLRSVPGGISAVYIKNNDVRGFILKGLNDYEQKSVAPLLKFNLWEISASSPCDISAAFSLKRMRIMLFAERPGAKVKLKIKCGGNRFSALSSVRNGKREPVKVSATKNTISFEAESVSKDIFYDLEFK